MVEKEKSIIVTDVCPNCGNDHRFFEDWPKPSLIQCGVCYKRYKKEELSLTAKLIEHPSIISAICPACDSCFIRKKRKKKTRGFRLFRVICFNCNQIFWYAYERKSKRLLTAKGAESIRKLSSYSSYRQRFKATINGSKNARLKKLYKQDPISVKYTKKERFIFNFDAQIPHHPAVRIFENNTLIYNEILNTSRKLVPINKRGKLWDYLILAVIQVVLFQREQGELMPNLPELWGVFKPKKFYWKTYRKHLLFVISHTQPYIRNVQIIKKKPEAWLLRMMQWYESIHET